MTFERGREPNLRPLEEAVEAEGVAADVGEAQSLALEAQEADGAARLRPAAARVRVGVALRPGGALRRSVAAHAVALLVIVVVIVIVIVVFVDGHDRPVQRRRRLHFSRVDLGGPPARPMPTSPGACDAKHGGSSVTECAATSGRGRYGRM